jgi:hypothetical protein
MQRSDLGLARWSRLFITFNGHFAERLHRLPLLTLRELYMLRIMNDITDKPNWESKVGHSWIIWA